MSDIRIIERYEDMSPRGRLQLFLQPDGDVIVHVIPDPDQGMRHASHTAEFCSIGAGGGRSPNTLAALRELARAMERDNEEIKVGRPAPEPGPYKPRPDFVSVVDDISDALAKVRVESICQLMLVDPSVTHALWVELQNAVNAVEAARSIIARSREGRS